MRFNDGSFIDLNEFSYLRFPHVAIKAADVANGEIRVEADLYQHQGLRRRVFYEDADNVLWYLELVPYVHPTGASGVSLGSMAYDATTGKATWTPSKEGYFINWDGSVTAGGESPEEVAGLLLTDYYEHFTENFSELENFRYQTIAEGDFLYVVQAGRVEAYIDGAATDGDALITSATAGQLTPAAAIDTTSAVTLWATIVERLFHPVPDALAVARCRGTIGAAGLAACDLFVPNPNA